MKQLYFLDEEEKNRILNLHESATKRHYLSEQAASPEWLPDPTKNPNWEYQFKDNKWFARKKNNPTIEYNISVNKKYADSVKKLNDAYPNGVMPSVKTDTNPDPSKAATVTANVAQTTPATGAAATGAAATGAAATGAAATGAAATGTNTSTGTAAGTNAGSGVISLNVNDIVTTSETGAPAVAGTDTAETNMSSSTPVVKASNAPDEDNSVNPNITNK
jgi:hypothetical protein